MENEENSAINDIRYHLLESISRSQSRCQECVYLNRGVCSATNDSVCNCFNGFDGDLCRVPESPPLQSSTPSTNWTVAVAVISAVAGILLIIALSVIAFYVISRRNSRARKAR